MAARQRVQMAAEAGRLHTHLLIDSGDEWEGTSPNATVTQMTMPQLEHAYPDHVVRYLMEAGMKRLGSFTAPHAQVLHKFSKEPLLVIGASNKDFDWETAWRRHLQLSARDPVPVVPASQRRRMYASGELWSYLRFLVNNQLLKPSLTEVAWTLKATLEAYVVTIREAAAPGHRGVLQPLLRRWQAGACSGAVFGLPVVEAVVTFKWRTFARQLLLVELLLFLIWLFAFTGSMLLYQEEDVHEDLRQMWGHWSGRIGMTLDVLALVAMLPFVVLEACTIRAYGWGWISGWNALDMVTYGLQLAIGVMHLGRWGSSTRALELVISLQCIALWTRLLYFFRVFRSATFDLVDSLRCVLTDVRWYLFVMLLLMWGFACGFYTLFRQDPEVEAFSTLALSYLTMFSYAVGGSAYYLDTMTSSHNPLTATFLCIVYQFGISMVLMSLLIGVMTNSLLKATKDENVRHLLSRAQIIDELEAVMPAWLRRLNPRWCPSYLHVLRVKPMPGRDWEEEEQQGIHGEGDPGGMTGETTPDPSGGASPLLLELHDIHEQLKELTARVDQLCGGLLAEGEVPGAG